MRRRSKGFTLIELIIALSLSAFVLIGIISVATTMIRSHFDAVRRGEVSGATLYSLARMNRELENGTRLVLPNDTTIGGSELLGCSNYSSLLPGNKIDASTRYTSFYYCVADDGNGPSLWRYASDPAADTCWAAAPTGTCGIDVAGATKEIVVYRNFWGHPNGQNHFLRDNNIGGVWLNYRVGIATATAQQPVPIYYEFSTRIGMNKTYNSGD